MDEQYEAEKREFSAWFKTLTEEEVMELIASVPPLVVDGKIVDRKYAAHVERQLDLTLGFEKE